MNQKANVPGPGAKILLLLFAFVVLAGLELFAGFFLAPSRLETILSVLKRDSHLIWSMRSNLETEFFGAPISTDSDGFRLNGHDRNDAPEGTTFRIVTLGASPSFGWGVADHQTYSALLERSLSDKFPGRTSVSALNASVIGYSSHQGRLLFEKNAPHWKPDLVIVAYGINDVDSYRFFSDDGSPDQDTRKESDLVVNLHNLLSPLAVVTWMNRLIHGTSSPHKRLSLEDVDRLSAPRSPRVPLKSYLENIAAIADRAIARQAQVLVLKMDLNLPRGDDPSDSDQATRLVVSAREAIEKGQCLAALPLLEKAAQLNPLAKSPHLYAAKCHLDSGHEELAARSFEKAEKTDAFRARRRSEEYNDALHTLSGRPGLTVVDLVERFTAENADLYVDPRLDTIHPNARGHEIIADVIQKRIVESWDK
jgi:lysophospholipase L1-like esterase